MGVHQNCLSEAILMTTHNVCFGGFEQKCY